MGRIPGPGPQGPPVFKFLGLTAVQEQAVQAVRDKHQPALMAGHRLLGEKAAAVRDGMENPALSEPQLRALLAAENEARLQVVLEQRATFQEAFALLSAEQQAKAVRLNQKRQKEREARRDVMEEEGLPGGPRP
jgi:Spy/CpxP family protein refolding chaperone